MSMMAYEVHAPLCVVSTCLRIHDAGCHLSIVAESSGPFPVDHVVCPTSIAKQVPYAVQRRERGGGACERQRQRQRERETETETDERENVRERERERGEREREEKRDRYIGREIDRERETEIERTRTRQHTSKRVVEHIP